jgi:hypothetical protein
MGGRGIDVGEGCFVGVEVVDLQPYCAHEALLKDAISAFCLRTILGQLLIHHKSHCECWV